MAKKGFSTILLAAGKGTRMKSPLPKVLHPVAGHPMISRIVGEVKKAGAKEIRAVLGFGENLVKQVIEPLGACSFHQKEQMGTADAVRAAQPESLEGTVLILNGDHPLIEADEIRALVSEFDESNYDLCVVTAVVPNPKGFGRIVRQNDTIKAIVEEKDASYDTKQICEINTGVYLIRSEVLNEYLPQIKSENAQGEFYLTDIISLGLKGGSSVGTLRASRKMAFGVNSQEELAKATGYIFRRKARQLMESGVMMVDPKVTYIEDDVEIGEGTVVYPGVLIKGPAQVGRFCVLEPNSVINRCELGDSVQVRAGCYLQEAVIKEKAQLGPYAHIRPGSEVGVDARIGNFVELKKVKFGDRAKASHLTYLGDAEIGEDTNIGCGTITCNYAVDRKKYKTIIGKNAFIGSDTQFIAPVEVGDGAVVASGSTITKNVPAGALAVARGKQIIKENYKPAGTSNVVTPVGPDEVAPSSRKE